MGVAAAIVGLIDRPDFTTLAIATLILAIGWATHWWLWYSTRPPRPKPVGSHRPARLPDGTLESPALISLLTNGFQVPPSAVAATGLDLSARRWIRLVGADEEIVVVTESDAPHGDSLRGYEQHVLNHLAAASNQGVVPMSTVATRRGLLTRRWWMSFRRSIADESQALDLSRPRYPNTTILGVAAATLLGLLLALASLRFGTEVAIIDSWKSRLWWFVVLGGLLALAWHIIERWAMFAQVPTDFGIARSSAWLGYRQRLADRIPPHASIIGTPGQQSALAIALVTGVADHLYRQFPIVRQGTRFGWSSAGGVPHTVEVQYPIRPGYGQHPLVALAMGSTSFVILWLLRGFVNGVAAGDRLASWVDKLDDQRDIAVKTAEFVSLLFLVPMALAVWLVVAGVVDSVYTSERSGFIVRTRPTSAVISPRLERLVRPWGHRSANFIYIAVDDGDLDMVTAWLATERTAVPQGVMASVRATPLLGYVRSAAPIGASMRSEMRVQR